MSEVKRFDVIPQMYGSDTFVETDTGDWVRAEDHDAEINKLREENRTLRAGATMAYQDAAEALEWGCNGKPSPSDVRHAINELIERLRRSEEQRRGALARVTAQRDRLAKGAHRKISRLSIDSLEDEGNDFLRNYDLRIENGEVKEIET